MFGRTLYAETADGIPQTAIDASLGCGVPTAVADLHEGETVLDLELARANAQEAGALTESEFRSARQDAGFAEIEIRETHRVHEHAAAAIIRARKPTV